MIPSFIQRQLHRLAGSNRALYKQLKDTFKTDPELVVRLLEDPHSQEKVNEYLSIR